MKLKYSSFWFFSLFLSLNISHPYQAQSECYTVRQIPYVPLPTTPPPGSTTITFGGEDLFSNVIPLGFTFNFFGVDYTDIVVGPNGFISFNLDYALDLCPWPIVAIPDNLVSRRNKNSIMFPWRDLIPSSSGTCFYYVRGIAPNREFVVAFNDVTNYAFSCSEFINTQGVVLYETSNDIDIVIAESSSCINWDGGRAVEGIQNVDGTSAFVVPGRNDGSWEAEEDSHRFSLEAGPITGAISPCKESSQVYSIDPILNAISYDWNIPADWTITNDTGTSITVTVGDSSGQISVDIDISCGIVQQTLEVSVSDVISNLPTIQGPTVIPPSRTITYTLPLQLDDVIYDWTFSGDDTTIYSVDNRATLTFGPQATEGVLSVTITNQCGISAASTLAINIEEMPSELLAIFKKSSCGSFKFYNYIYWNASPSSEVASYRIYRNNELIAEVGSSQLKYKDPTKLGDGQVEYAVTMVNTSGVESSPIIVTVEN